MNTAMSTERPMSEDQRRKIFALCAEQGVDEELRHDMQFALTGKASLKDFTSANANVVIDHLQRLAPAGRSQAKARVPMPTSGATPHRTTRTGSSPVAGPSSGDGWRRHTAPVPNLPSRGAGTNLPGATLKRDAEGAGVISRPSAIPSKPVHKLPSPAQLRVLERLYDFAGYKTEEARKNFAERVEKHARPRSAWEAEELIFALLPQAAPNMYNHMMHEIRGVLTPYERGFLFSNRDDHGGFNSAKLALERYMRAKNKRGSRTTPRLSLTKFFEIMEKYK